MSAASRRWYIRASLLLLALLVVLAGAWLLPRAGVPTRFWLAPLETVRVAGHELQVVRTESKGEGLMGVTSLGALDGMLFVFESPRQPPAGMFMKDTLIPLDAGFFDAGGRLIEVIAMPLCQTRDCPTFSPSRAFQFVIESPTGNLSWMRPGDVLLR